MTLLLKTLKEDINQSINSGDSKFHKTGKSKKANNQIVYSDTQIQTYLKLGIEYDNENDINIHRQIGISFDKRHDFDLDYGYDSYAFDIQETDAYWQFPGNQNKYSIAGIEEISDDLTFPIVLKLHSDKKVKILVDEHRNLERDVYLVDNITNLSYKITNTPIELD